MNSFLTNRQISFILYCILIGYGVINLPKNAAEVAGTGSWLSLLIVTIVFMVITYMITYLQYVYEGETLYEYSYRLVGNYIAHFFVIIYGIYFFINFSMIIRLYAEVIKLTILINTPIPYICVLFYMVIFYALTKGLNVIARMCEIYGLLNILGFIFVNSLLITKGSSLNIRPLFVIEDLTSYLKAIPTMALPFLGMEMLLFIPISRTKNKNIFKYTTLMVGFIGIIYIYIVECTTSVVGVDTVIYLKESIFTVVRGIDLPYLEFIRRLDGIYIIFWTMNVVCALSLWVYGVTIIISKISENIKYNHISIAITFISFIFSQLPKTKNHTELIIKYNSYFGIISSAVIPAILLFITKVKKYDNQK
jgi:spore germination protein